MNENSNDPCNNVRYYQPKKSGFTGISNMMKIFLKLHLLILFAVSALCQNCALEQRLVKPVELPPNIPPSKLYSIKANGIEIPVGHEVSNDSIFETTAFTMQGKVKLVIELQADIDNYSIHPLSKNITAGKDGKKLSFTIDKPLNLLVKINDLVPLLVFATPPERDIPDKSDDNVLYFGPGEHDVGRLQLQSNQTVYLAAGATFYGTLEGEGVENVQIMGRGILDGSKHTSWDERIFGIYFERSKNITIEGIGIRNCYWWVTHFLLCENVNISHINLFSFYRNNGGLMLDGCSNYTASNSIILTNDDCICPHALNAAGNGEPVARDYTFKNMVLYNVLSGNGIRIGASFETSKCINWLFENIDLLTHSGAAIISDHSDWATMENLWFVNFFDEQAYNNTINFFIDSTNYSCFTGYKSARGNMEKVRFVNLKTPGGGIVLKGYDQAHKINDIHFYDCTIGENQVNALSGISVNEFVTNIGFSSHRAVYQPVILPKDTSLFTNSPDELILDNLSEGSRFVGFEYVSGESGFINKDYHETTVPEGFSNFKAAIFEPAIKGDYEIYIHWKAIENGASNAKWIVHHSGGYSTKYMNQRASQGWQLHGSYHLDGTSSVRLSLPGYFQIADGNVVADAVKFTKMKK
jgi:hypothetical protein